MIYLSSTEGQHIVVLEPYNLDLIKGGKPIASPDKTVFIAYCPDVDWLSLKIQELIKEQGREFSIEKLDSLLQEGLTRKEIYRSDNPMKKVL